jgi:hypothetical protein
MSAALESELFAPRDGCESWILILVVVEALSGELSVLHVTGSRGSIFGFRVRLIGRIA